MRVSSINSSMAFKSQNLEEQFANLSDRDIQKLAYMKAGQDVNDKKHRRIDKAIYYSLPLAGGISTMASDVNFIDKKALWDSLKSSFPKGSERKSVIQNIINKGEAIVSKPDRFRSLRLLAGLGSAISWAAAIGTFAATWKAKNLIDKHSETARNFSDKHPLVSTVGTFVAGLGALFGVRKVMNTVAIRSAAQKVQVPVLRTMVKLKNAINNNVLNGASKMLTKVPSSIKQIGKGALAWLPLVMITTSILHSINHDNVKIRQANKNYNDLKIAQEVIRRGSDDAPNKEVDENEVDA